LTSRNLPAANRLPVKKRGKGVEKLGGLACVKEPSRDVYYKVITKSEELFDDHI
jgi:hypothetical protein